MACRNLLSPSCPDNRTDHGPRRWIRKLLNFRLEFHLKRGNSTTQQSSRHFQLAVASNPPDIYVLLQHRAGQSHLDPGHGDPASQVGTLKISFMNWIFFRSRLYTHTLCNVVNNFCWFLVTKTFHDIQVWRKKYYWFKIISKYYTSSNWLILFYRFHLDSMPHFLCTGLYLSLEYFSSTQMFQKQEENLVKRYQLLLMMTRKILGFWNKKSLTDFFVLFRKQR